MRVGGDNLAAVEYDEQSKTMTVQFKKSGAVYEYYEVPPDVATGLQKAASPGSYLHSNIKDRYEYRRLA